ncbi:hypothetical protein [Streptomyces sp. NPDC089919]|uniref:hypothetical protein n=1 Tax=Streptomyces sp. NPDC089919 TaxID=3155188 RepID=UPI00341B881D
MKQNQGWGAPDPSDGAGHGPYGPQHGPQDPYRHAPGTPPPPGPYGYPGGYPGGPAPAGPPGWGWAPPPPPRPGVIPLRPLTLGDVLGGAFSTFGRYWKQLVGVMLTVQGVGVLLVTGAVAAGIGLVHTHLDGVFDRPAGEDVVADDLRAVLLALIPVGVLLLAVVLVGWAVISALTPAVLQEAVLGRRTTYGAMFRRAWSRLPAMLGTLLLTALLAGGPVLLVAAAAVAAIVSADYSGEDVSPAVVLLPLGVLATLPLSVWLGVRFSLAPAAVVVEGLGPVAALRRSAALVKGAWWRIFGITLLTVLIASVIGYVIQLPFTFVGMFALFPAALLDAGDADGSTAGMVLGMVVYCLCILLGMVVSQLFQLGLPQLATGLLYVDQRMRQEGLAPALLAAATGEAPPQGAPPAGPPSGQAP